MEYQYMFSQYSAYCQTEIISYCDSSIVIITGMIHWWVGKITDRLIGDDSNGLSSTQHNAWVSIILFKHHPGGSYGNADFKLVSKISGQTSEH